MIDPDLFIRGHINVRINDRPIDDYDIVIPEHYFEDMSGYKGEVIDSNGSEYEVVELTPDDRFEIVFTVDEVAYESITDGIIAFDELVVKCTGEVIQIDGSDVLDIETYDVISYDGLRYE